MVRAMKKPGGTTAETLQYNCTSCDRWYDDNQFTCETAYTVDDHLGYYNGDEFYNDYTSWEVWTCDSCSEIISLDEPPQSRTVHAGNWVCGECKSEYEDQEDARYCCD